MHVLAKPTGAQCNLDCSYCFYLSKESLYPDSDFRMTDEVLDSYLRQLIESSASPQVTVSWQGGEPTLMGLDFFRRAIELAEKYRRPGMIFEHTLQTNGTTLDEEWCRFLRQHGFLVGISIDGPRELHDAHRVDKGGKPTFDEVMRGLRLLQQHGVEHNVLTTVNRRNADHPLAVYRFLRDEAQATWIQLIPVVERQTELVQLGRGPHVTPQSVHPEQLGTFLCAVFDEWVRHDVGRIFVPTFEGALANWLGLPSSGMCIFDETCGHALVIEHNGDLYSCDHFVTPEHRIGNVREQHLAYAASSAQQQRFGLAKQEGLPQVCRTCDVRFACHGECPKNRFAVSDDGEPGLNYLCQGYKQFFHHIGPSMRRMAQLVREGRPASEVMGPRPMLF
jgi:uncharacterized protein